MLEELRFRDLGVIADVTVPFADGLIVLTGETGAGKTMVLTGLALLLGARADTALVRTGAERAVVEGRFRVDPDGPAARRAVAAGAELDDDGSTLQLCRTVSADGRSRAYLGGRSVPAAVLAELAADLVTVLGQAQQHRLSRAASARSALDRFAGAAVTKKLQVYKALFDDHTAVSRDLTELTDRLRERAREADLLRHGLAEIAAVAPVPGEDLELAAEVARLAHGDALRTAAQAAHDALGGEETDSAQPLVATARRFLDAERSHDATLAALAERAAEISYLLADLVADLASYATDVDADPQRLAQAQERQAALSALTRKYGADLTAVLAWAEEAGPRLCELDGDDDRLTALQQRHADLQGRLASAAADLTRARASAARRLEDALTHELRSLAMPDASVAVQLASRDAADGLSVEGRVVAFGRSGVDLVELSLSPHAGEVPRPIGRIASGGELSRIVLAFEAALAGTERIPTRVFDEVDAGVGGRTAVEVGRRLARLADDGQVLVVTHLPQVAAFADRHLVVTKSAQGSVTSGDVQEVVGGERVRELTRMLAGLEDSELGRGHAEELLQTAHQAKTATR